MSHTRISFILINNLSLSSATKEKIVAHPHNNGPMPNDSMVINHSKAINIRPLENKHLIPTVRVGSFEVGMDKNFMALINESIKHECASVYPCAKSDQDGETSGLSDFKLIENYVISPSPRKLIS